MTGAFSLDGPVEVIAHRGYSARAPENTVVALRMGLEAGADAVEFDLHAAADGTPYLFHDDTLARTTDGAGRIRRLEPAEIDRLDAGSWFHERFAGEPVPSLAAALADIGDAAARLYPELKSVRDPTHVDRIADAVADAGLLAKSVFISMDWDALARIRARQPEALVGYIVERARRTDDAIALAAGDERALLDFDHRLLLSDPAKAQRASAEGIELAVWTVNDVDTANALLDMGVRRFTTNEVERLVAWREAL